VSALVLVGQLGVNGTGMQIGNVTAEQLAEAQRRQAQQDANKAAAAAAAAERAATAAAAAAYSPVGAPGVPGARPSMPGVGIPDNFFGFVILTLGLR